jgi:hypothetical protein
VSANVYEAGVTPSGPVAGLVAYDRSGKELWRSP